MLSLTLSIKFSPLYIQTYIHILSHMNQNPLLNNGSSTPQPIFSLNPVFFFLGRFLLLFLVMGNYISCTLAPPLMKNTRAARVIFPTGEVKQYKAQVNAAELMLECPSYFLANSRSLHIGRRFSALAADEELEFGNVYIFFPMRRVNSVVTAADMAVLFMAANSAAKRLSGCVLPEKYGGGGESLRGECGDRVKSQVMGGVENEVPRLSLEGVESGLFENRLSYCRSRKPVLETINEEPIWSR